MRREKKELVIPTDWRKKLTVRSKSRQLLNKGIIKKQPCQLCYDENSKMTHIDYEDPTHVTWLCKKHFDNFQKERRRINTENVPQGT